MAKKHKKHGKKMHGAGIKHAVPAVYVMGKRPAVKHKKRHGRLMGGDGFGSRVGHNALNTLSGVAGGVGGAFAMNLLPIQSNAKRFAAIVAGLLLASATSIPAVKFAGIGISISGGLSLVKALLPSVPVLAGDPLILIPDASGESTLRLREPAVAGDPIDVAESMGWVTANDA